MDPLIYHYFVPPWPQEHLGDTALYANRGSLTLPAQEMVFCSLDPYHPIIAKPSILLHASLRHLPYQPHHRQYHLINYHPARKRPERRPRGYRPCLNGEIRHCQPQRLGVRVLCHLWSRCTPALSTFINTSIEIPQIRVQGLHHSL